MRYINETPPGRLQDLPVGGVVFRDVVAAKDADAGINALVEYKVVPNRNFNDDGFGTFEFKLPNQPVLTLAKQLDFETVSRYTVTVVASVSAHLPLVPKRAAPGKAYIVSDHFISYRIELSELKTDSQQRQL